MTTEPVGTAAATPSPSPPVKAEAETIDWDNPKLWSVTRKWIITGTTSLMAFSSTFASSVFSTAIKQTSEEFNVSSEVMTLGVSLFVLGYCVGPLLWGPLSEVHGRRLPLMLGSFAFCVFQVPVAVAKNAQTVLVCRFIGGIFASSALGIMPAVLTDIWNPVERGIAACIYSTATFAGPVTGPIIGGFLVESYLGWRWTAWITLIEGGAFWALGMLLVPETYAPVLLRRRARALRGTADESANTAPEHRVGLREFVTKFLTRPPSMLVTELVLVLMTLYMSLVYGTLYLFFEAYPISFQEERGWSPGVGALPFLGLTVGVVCGNLTIGFITVRRFKKKYLEGGNKVAPEERLIPMMIGAAILPIGLFWFAWTSNPHITWVPQVVAGALIGMGIQLVYTMGYNYILDVYTPVAASAVAANTFVRCIAGAGFPLFAAPMYHKLGVGWATSVLGFLSVALMPVPFLFFKYGKRVRKIGRFAVP
ncbi:MFS general substrate transporter [Hypoxylon sp. FL0543]|nr:MFS general substrate transporter [Hypoxylon sp. FL0543]